MHEHFDRTTLGSDANDARGFCFARCICGNRKCLRVIAADELEGLIRRCPAWTVRKRNPETRARKAEGYASPKPAGTAGNEREPSVMPSPQAERPFSRANFIAVLR